MFEVMLSGNTSTVLGDTLVVLVSMTLLLFLVKYFAWDKVNAMLESRCLLYTSPSPRDS